MLTDYELKAIRARADATTWPALVETLRESADLLERFARKKGDEAIIAQMRAAADEVAHARTDVPTLVDEVQRLRKHSAAFQRMLATHGTVAPTVNGTEALAESIRLAIQEEALPDDILDQVVEDYLRIRK